MSRRPVVRLAHVCVRARYGDDSFRRSSRRSWRDGRGDRRRRASLPDPRDLQDTSIRDGLVSHVTVTDRHHALCGQLLPLVSLHSARGPAYVVVALPDGRRRSLRRASTDLAGTAEAPSLARILAVCDGPRISVGTLLPLARHIVARLAIAVEEVTHDDHAPSVAAPAPGRAVGIAAAAALAEPAERDANTDRPASRRAAAPDGAEGRLDQGDFRC